MLLTSGVQQVSLLAGALTPGRAPEGSWKRDNRRPRRKTFTPRIAANCVRPLDDIRRISVDRSAQIVDAPPGLLRGHIPGSLISPGTTW